MTNTILQSQTRVRREIARRFQSDLFNASQLRAPVMHETHGHVKATEGSAAFGTSPSDREPMQALASRYTRSENAGLDTERFYRSEIIADESTAAPQWTDGFAAIFSESPSFWKVDDKGRSGSPSQPKADEFSRRRIITCGLLHP
jgi:hypothetical protein